MTPDDPVAVVMDKECCLIESKLLATSPVLTMAALWARVFPTAASRLNMR